MKYTYWLRALCTLQLLSFALCAPMPTKPGEPSMRAPGRQHIENAQQSTTDVRRVQGAPGSKPTWETVELDSKREVKRGEHADHMLEVQTVKKALKDQGVEYKDLHPTHQTKIREILNDRWNMQLVDGPINIGKGSVTRFGLMGKAIAPKADRDGYTRETVAHGIQTAERLDRYFETINHKGKQLTGNVRDTHKKAMGPEGAKILKQGEPTPQLPHHLRRPSSAGTHSGTPSPAHSPLSPLGTPGHDISLSPKGTPHPKDLKDFKLPPIPSYAEILKSKSRSPSPTERLSRLNLDGPGPSGHGHGHGRTASSSSDSSHDSHGPHSPTPGPHHSAHRSHPPSHHPPAHGHQDHSGGSPSPLRITIPKRSRRLLEKSNPKTPEAQIGGSPHTPSAPARPAAHRPTPRRYNSVG